MTMDPPYWSDGCAEESRRKTELSEADPADTVDQLTCVLMLCVWIANFNEDAQEHLKSKQLSTKTDIS
jgi:hypothetical protein